MFYKKNIIKNDHTPCLFILSKQKKLLMRIRTGNTSDSGPNNCIGVFKNDTQEVQELSLNIKLMEREIKDIPELIKFGFELEKMFPKNSVAYDLQDDDTNIKMIKNLNMDLEKYRVLKGLADLGEN